MTSMKFNLEIKQKGKTSQHHTIEAEGCIEAVNKYLDENEGFDEKNIEKIKCEIE